MIKPNSLKARYWWLIAMILPLALLLLGDWAHSTKGIQLFNDIGYWLLYAAIGLPCFYLASLKWLQKPIKAMITTGVLWLLWGVVMMLVTLTVHVHMGWTL